MIIWNKRRVEIRVKLIERQKTMDCKTPVISVRADAKKRKEAVEGHFRGVKTGIADGKYGFVSAYDKAFDDMDAETV